MLNPYSGGPRWHAVSVLLATALLLLVQTSTGHEEPTAKFLVPGRASSSRLALEVLCSTRTGANLGACCAERLYGNLNNQRISFFAAIIACKHLGATLVMPQWQGHLEHGQPVPASQLWDVEHLLQRAAASGVSILVSPEGARAQLCPSRGDGSAPELAAHLQLFTSQAQGTLCVSPNEAFYHLWKFNLTEEESRNQAPVQMHKTIAHSAQFAEARSWLQPARSLRERARAIVTALMGGKDFAALHLRIEGDFVWACGLWPKVDGLECMLDERQTAEALEKHGVQAGSVLYLFPSPAPEAVPTLCQRYKCMHRGGVDAADDLLYNERALLDFTVAMHASAAYGNIYSTMSVELVASMRAEGKPAAFLNPPCPPGPESACP